MMFRWSTRKVAYDAVSTVSHSRWDFYRRLRSLIGGWLGPNKPNKNIESTDAPERQHRCRGRRASAFVDKCSIESKPRCLQTLSTRLVILACRQPLFWSRPFN